MIGPFIARLLVTAENQNREVDSEPDEDRAESDRHHVELVENQKTGGERDETTEQKRESHSKQRQPAMKTDEENCADQNYRTE